MTLAKLIPEEIGKQWTGLSPDSVSIFSDLIVAEFETDAQGTPIQRHLVLISGECCGDEAVLTVQVIRKKGRKRVYSEVFTSVYDYVGQFTEAVGGRLTKCVGKSLDPQTGCGTPIPFDTREPFLTFSNTIAAWVFSADNVLGVPEDFVFLDPNFEGCDVGQPDTPSNDFEVPNDVYDGEDEISVRVEFPQWAEGEVPFGATPTPLFREYYPVRGSFPISNTQEILEALDLEIFSAVRQPGEGPPGCRFGHVNNVIARFNAFNAFNPSQPFRREVVGSRQSLADDGTSAPTNECTASLQFPPLNQVDVVFYSSAGEVARFPFSGQAGNPQFNEVEPSQGPCTYNYSVEINLTVGYDIKILSIGRDDLLIPLEYDLATVRLPDISFDGPDVPNVVMSAVLDINENAINLVVNAGAESAAGVFFPGVGLAIANIVDVNVDFTLLSKSC